MVERVTKDKGHVQTQQLALFGHPVAHSQSPKIHQGFAAQFDLNINYQLIDVMTEQLGEKVRGFFAQGGVGANITVPHKQNIIPVLDQISDRAQLAGAVNTLYYKDNQLWGDNTDGAGFVMDLYNKGVIVKGQSILIIGAGGASKGIIPALLAEQPKQIHITNRSIDKAIALADQFEVCDAVTDETVHNGYDLIIHATSMGHQGLCPNLNAGWFKAQTVVYDLSYGDAAEPFLNAAKAHGSSQVYDGLGMLYGQAALAFAVWFDEQPFVAP